MEEERIDNLATSREAREQQLIAKAERLAEQKLEDGTASPQIIVHYLKLATAREEKERAILDKQVELITAKTQSLQYASKIDSLFEEAISAFRRYSGESDETT